MRSLVDGKRLCSGLETGGVASEASWALRGVEAIIGGVAGESNHRESPESHVLILRCNCPIAFKEIVIMSWCSNRFEVG